MSDRSPPVSLDGFLDRVAAKTATPGGGGVVAAAGAMSCAMARMAAAYSPGKQAEPGADEIVAGAVSQLERCDRALRTLVSEDAAAYTSLTNATRDLRKDPATQPAHDIAVGVAIAVPLEMAALATTALDVMQRLLPAANRYLLSDLGVAAVLAEATVRAASYMVHVNTASLTDEDARREHDAHIGRLVDRASASLGQIESALGERV